MISKSKEGIGKMPTCQNCDQKWGWKQTLKKSFTLDTGMICPYCEKKQYTTKKVDKYIPNINMIKPTQFKI
jgi:CXXC-20-CXXC protein